ncbi:MAG: VWA domain-containing protein [Deltaproteobacteria bacterium]|nr:VWA domain-containing protein [Deltaproteobacteria bacterium]
MTFGAPALLHLLWLVPALVVLVAWAARRRRQDAERLIAARLLDRGLPPLLERRRAWRATLTLLGVALACVAAAQPRWGFTTIERKLRGVEIIVALDVSNSMLAEDVKPSRMERAKREVIDLLELLQSDRVGVVIFAAGAYPRVPLTTDYVALRRILEDTSPSMLRAQGSDLAAAMTESLKLFGEDRGADRAIVVISDGESHSGALDEVGATLKEAGVRVYALGVGTPDGAPIPEAKGGFKLDRSGQMVLSRLDESALSQLAAATGGATIRSVASASDTAQIVGELRASMVRQTEESRRQRVWNERFQWPLAAGLGLMVLAALLGDGRVRAVALALLVVGVAQAGDLDDARSLSAQGRHDEALRSYTELLAEAPDDPAIRWGMAEALYRAGRYEDAARGFQELAARAPERYRADAHYNAGNAQYRAGRLDDAVKSWEQALAARPDHAGAQKNVEQVRQEIAARQAPPPESQDGAPQDGEPQDGQPQDGQPQDGQPQDGEPQDGQPQSGQPQDGEGAPQDQRPQDGGERSPQDGERSQTKPGEAQPDGGENTPNEGEAQGEAQAGQPSDEAPPPGAASGMSPAEAQRLLDAVEEGTPRVFIDGYPKEKDW